MKRIALTAAIFCIAFAGCSEDDPAKPAPEQPSSSPATLTQRWHVIHQLEAAYNERNITTYNRLLDDVFNFFLAGPGPTLEQWDRATDIAATSNMLDQNYSGDNRILTIDVNLQLFPLEDVVWTEIVPTNFPNELWYTTVVRYDFTFTALPGITWIAEPGVLAQFTVRMVTDTGGKEIWRLVEWRDLRQTRGQTVPAPAIESVSWGSVKAEY